MPTEPITIEVSSEIARAFRRATPEQRRRLEDAVRRALSSRQALADEFRDLTARISAEARARGLTDEALDDLLRGDDGE